MSSRISFPLAVLILLIAAGLRLSEFTTLPPGLHEDEITDIRITERVRQGDIRVFFDLSGTGREGFYHIVEAASTSLVGTGTVGYRMLSFWAGMLTLAATYVLARRLYGPLAGIMALGLLAFTMWPILLSRTVGRETIVPLMVAGILLALARALPISVPHHRPQFHGASTTAFAALGILMGISLYLYPTMLMMILACMVFITYMLATRQPMSRRRLSYIGFAILIMLILSVPYLVSSIRLPQLAATGRIFGYDNGLLRTLADGLVGVIFKGDANPVYNLPGRPLIDLVSGLGVLVGLIAALRYWRQPRYALPIIMAVVLAPAAFLSRSTPNFRAFTVILPIIALLFGLGARVIVSSFPHRVRPYLGLGLVALLAFNIGWTINDLYRVWPARDDMQTAYHARLGQIAHYLDQTAGSIPTLICAPDVDANSDPIQLNSSSLLLVMMNRKTAALRYANCATGLVFTGGGSLEQVVLPRPETLDGMNPYLRAWLDKGTPLQASGLPRDGVIILNIASELADTVGRFTTTAPVGYAPEAPSTQGQDTGPAAPPVRLGGNLTFLGYDRTDTGDFKPGDTVTVITYWRVDGMLPPDVRLFVHVLYDPVTIAAQHDTISIDPTVVLPRDVFVQITYVPLPYNLAAGQYSVSVGAFQSSLPDQPRLDVFDGDTPRGKRLFLYPITVVNPAESGN